MNKKRSFFERLSGTMSVNDSLEPFDDERPSASGRGAQRQPARSGGLLEEDAQGGEGQLPVDVHQTPTEIVLRAFVAGVRPDELSLSIGREMVVIEGSRFEREQIAEPDYFTRELFWGSFIRTILLPQEIDVDNASALSKDGLLTLTLPKLDKAKQTKLRVKAG